MRLSDAINLAMINGKGEARRRMGMDYVKAVPIPRTVSEAADLVLNHETYGLTTEELYKVTKGTETENRKEK